jgi:phospholipid/cholesterol/gamma-HCH transport system substrate-binding protein
MSKQTVNNTKLGLFVMAGLVFLVFSLYMIGRNRNLFGSTFTVYAQFYNVDGLTPGNNVRFSGIDVGTVSKVVIESDSTIRVTMVLDRKVKQHLRQNALASIGTDGLMGNKLINISAQPGESPLLESGSTIGSLRPIETDAMLRTLNTTNNNIEIITQNLKSITQKLNSNNSVWTLLADTIIARDLTEAMADIRKASENTIRITDKATALLEGVKRGEGLAGEVLTDTVVFYQLKSTVNDLQKTSQQAKSLAADLDAIMLKIKSGEGTVGTLVYDTTIAGQLRRSMIEVEQGTSRFNENMEALKEHALFRGYYKRQAKEAAKTKN